MSGGGKVRCIPDIIDLRRDMIMLDTNHCLSFEPASPMGSPPIGEDLEKADLRTDLDRDVYHSLKEGGDPLANCTRSVQLQEM